MNPYEILYTYKMDIYREKSAGDGLFEDSTLELVATDIPCRYSKGSQVIADNPAPILQNQSHMLFCGLDVDIKEGDTAEVTHTQTGKKVKVLVGEGFPYLFQYQFKVERSEKI